jgi:hypothetical protein
MHRGPRRSVATGGRAPGVGRSAAAAEIYENESTPKFAAENRRRCKRMLEFVKEAVTNNDANITLDDASVASGKLSDMKWENIVHFLSTRKKQRNPGKGGPVTKGDLEKYKHAMVWYVVNAEDEEKQAADIWPNFDSNCSRFFSNYKRKLTKMKEAGELSVEEGSPSMPRAVYCWLCEKALAEGNHFAHLFLCLEWNLICRSVTTASVNLTDMRTFEDCLTFAFHRFKAKQEGTDETGKDTKHCSSNPLEGNEAIDLMLALALYLSTYADEYGSMESKKLFPMEDPASAFSKWLHRTLGGPEAAQLKAIKTQLGEEDNTDEERVALLAERARLRSHEGLQIQMKCVCALHVQFSDPIDRCF